MHHSNCAIQFFQLQKSDAHSNCISTSIIKLRIKTSTSYVDLFRIHIWQNKSEKIKFLNVNLSNK